MNGLLPPLPERLRPHSLDDYVGQRHLVGKGCILRNMIESGNLSCSDRSRPNEIYIFCQKHV